MTNDEINRKISEAREPDHATAGINNLTWWSEDRHGVRTPTDWTGSEDASAVLLEEMPFPCLEKRLDIEATTAQWHCYIDLRAEADGAPQSVTFGVDPDRKVAIALAWLKWKGLT